MRDKLFTIKQISVRLLTSGEVTDLLFSTAIHGAPMPDQPKGVLPHIIVDNCAAAIEFYIKALGAKELMRAPDKDGKRIMHAELEINGGVIYLNDDYPEYWGKSRTPKAFGGSPVVMHLNVANCDESFK